MGEEQQAVPLRGFLYHPKAATEKDVNEVLEQIKKGGVVKLPSTRDDQGNLLWQFVKFD